MTSGYEVERLAASWRAKKACGELPTLAEHEAIWDDHLLAGIEEAVRRRRDREQKAMLARLPVSGLPRA